jgi:hypothetical protein
MVRRTGRSANSLKSCTSVRMQFIVVHRIWKIAGVKPHRLERYMASNDADFESKAAAIIGLYLNHPFV